MKETVMRGQQLPGMAGKGNLPPGHCQGLLLRGRHTTPLSQAQPSLKDGAGRGWGMRPPQGTGQPPRPTYLLEELP